MSVLVMAGGGCRRAEAPPPPPAATPAPTPTPAPSPVDVAIPLGTPLTRQELERQRFDQQWLQQGSFQQTPAPAASGMPASGAPSPASASPGAMTDANVTFAKGGAPETFKGVDAASIDGLPMHVPIKGDVRGPSVLRTQVRLDRAGFAPGAVDGRWGKNSQIAVYWFQRQNGLPATGVVDEATYRALAGAAGDGPTLQSYTVTEEDAKGPFTTLPKDVYEKEKLDCLCYQDLLEALAERFHTTREFLQAMNPGATTPAAGQALLVPSVRTPVGEGAASDVTKIVVSVGGNYVHGLDDSGRILFHAPTTVGSKYDSSPSETLKITNIAWKPDFHYQPTLFADVPDKNPEAHLKPGPNSPVGVVWMALSREHFGIHGTDDPDSIGYASSHGCVRLANWDAADLGHRVKAGVPVEFVDTRGAVKPPAAPTKTTR
jgi:lipoprotein-anchoring transpeptidase ErfK/SrfK